MKLVKTCGCGGSIEVHYGGGLSRSTDDRERADALKQVERFDRQHRTCNAKPPSAEQERPA
jgi:hypothetical protein